MSLTIILDHHLNIIVETAECMPLIKILDHHLNIIDETAECMPLTIMLAHQLNKKIADLRKDGTLWWARPDSKAQV